VANGCEDSPLGSKRCLEGNHLKKSLKRSDKKLMDLPCLSIKSEDNSDDELLNLRVAFDEGVRAMQGQEMSLMGARKLSDVSITVAGFTTAFLTGVGGGPGSVNSKWFAGISIGLLVLTFGVAMKVHSPVSVRLTNRSGQLIVDEWKNQTHVEFLLALTKFLQTDYDSNKGKIDCLWVWARCASALCMVVVLFGGLSLLFR